MVETALISAIAAVIILLANIPFLVFLCIVAAVPMTVLTARRGIYAGLAGSVVTSVILLMTISPVLALLNSVMFCFSGVGAGFMIRKQWNTSRTVVISTLFFSAGLSLGIYLLFTLSGVDLFKMMDQGFSQASAFIQERGTLIKASQEDINVQLELIKLMKEILRKTQPALVISYGVLMSALNYFISRPILKRTGTPVADMTKFKDFKLPSSIMPGILLIVVLTFLTDYIGYIDSDIIFLNLVFIFSYVFAFQGASTLAFLTVERGGNVEKRSVLVVFATILCIMFFGIQVLSLLGLVDATIDIRKLYQNRKG